MPLALADCSERPWGPARGSGAKITVSALPRSCWRRLRCGGFRVLLRGMREAFGEGDGFGEQALKMPLRVGGESFAGLVKTQGSARQTRATLGYLLWPFQGRALRAFGSEARRMAYE